MKILMTGATGFIGRNLAESLHGDGLRIVATGRSAAVGEDLRKKGIEFQKADILDGDQLTKAFSAADCVIHCAAKTGDWGRYGDFYEINVIGTRNVMEASRRHGIKKIVFVSTPSVYFTGRDRYDISESEPLPVRQTTYYSKTKLIAETELMALRGEGCKVIILRPRAVYGPYDATFIPRILRMAEKKQMPLINGGRAMIDITYVDNVIEAVKKSLTAEDGAWNEVYNVSNGDPISVKDWFFRMLEVFGRSFNPKNVPEAAAKIMAGIMEFAGHLPFSKKQPEMTRFSVGYMAKSMTMNIDKAKQKLNYSPLVGNQQGFEKYAAWYRAK